MGRLKGRMKCRLRVRLVYMLRGRLRVGFMVD